MPSIILGGSMAQERIRLTKNKLEKKESQERFGKDGTHVRRISSQQARMALE